MVCCIILRPCYRHVHFRLFRHPTAHYFPRSLMGQLDIKSVEELRHNFDGLDHGNVLANAGVGAGAELKRPCQLHARGMTNK